MKNVKMTPAVRRALEAVAAGKVVRQYDTKGSRMECHAPHVSAAVLWRLSDAGWIEDARKGSGWGARYQLVLTPTGRAALEKETTR
jgi:hypothetical protein